MNPVAEHSRTAACGKQLLTSLPHPVRHLRAGLHVTPSPIHSGSLHAHVKEPSTFVQEALESQLLSLATAHSSTSVHWVPSPVNPFLQAHVKEPTLFVHEALLSQLFAESVAHSSTSEQAVPSPVYPLLHLHSKEPAMFLHEALVSQLFSLATAHSSTSVH